VSPTAAADVSFTYRPAVREQTPLIIGVAGPTKSGKTYSAHRLAIGLAEGGTVAMLNAEGARGHQYAERFKYVAVDIEPPYAPARYTAAVKAAAAIKPGALIIDSASHMHDGPGGMLAYHEEEIDRMLGQQRGDYKARERMTFAAWVRPKADENEFIYTLLGLKFPVVLCFRAKEKIKLVSGKPPIDLGWQPIVGDRVAFETIFTLMLPPHCKGVPDLEISDMREPFDAMVPKGKPIDEDLGRKLAAWSHGAGAKAPAQQPQQQPLSAGSSASPESAADLLGRIKKGFAQLALSDADQRALWTKHCQAATFLSEHTDVGLLGDLLADLRSKVAR